MKSFKGYLHRWMTSAAQLAPFLKDKIMDTLRTSTEHAVTACKEDGTCSLRWTEGAYDDNDKPGAGQQMNVLAALSTLLIDEQDVKRPVTNGTGGTSVGNPSAGQEAPSFKPHAPASTTDKAGAAVLTAVALVAMVTIMAWMSANFNERQGKGEKLLSRKGKGLAG